MVIPNDPTPSTTEVPWSLLQLQRMTRFFPERVEEAMLRLLELDPALRNDLVIGAVDQEMLTVSQAAEYVGMSVDEVESRLADFRQLMCQREVRIEKTSDRAVARISGAGISVWEVARELRKVGTVDRLQESFPTLSRAELSVALSYADKNADEINREIQRYDEAVQRRLSEYPFAK